VPELLMVTLVNSDAITWDRLKIPASITETMNTA
jgi:hypothetical protein